MQQLFGLLSIIFTTFVAVALIRFRFRLMDRRQNFRWTRSLTSKHNFNQEISQQFQCVFKKAVLDALN